MVLPCPLSCPLPVFENILCYDNIYPAIIINIMIIVVIHTVVIRKMQRQHGHSG